MLVVGSRISTGAEKGSVGKTSVKGAASRKLSCIGNAYCQSNEEYPLPHIIVQMRKGKLISFFFSKKKKEEENKTNIVTLTLEKAFGLERGRGRHLCRPVHA
jgi:hypothetical protein